MTKRVRLGVNIDHVATIRNARGVSYPDPARAAVVALEAGADGITAHLREDRRHISDDDITRLAKMLRQRDRPLNLEMAVTSEMLAIALHHKPHAVCLVPERREERTTEGGLDVAHGHNWIAPFVQKLRDNGSRVSLFIGADPLQIEAASRTGAEVIELHTGAFCDAARDGDEGQARAILTQLVAGAQQAASLGLEVHAGHGIDYETVAPIAAIPEVAELNIGHFLVGEAIFIGLADAVSEMRRRIDAARAPG
ncbi:pyridoxine 5'-phosphate synthase [Terricaulis silvestris]|uniref:Pyridoxine 5'-phosphate synthase n=1 Tax=Terricaulis silvestris TaxID=2686094 RepID=A0A6I6MKV3_9CAUL|nr:pyridoxine 5'-phosphate synthase [Terricaulis silvestris]QGZ95319.1 Pyridoxine 5'-phosphate synthase [Terricaulis silvestris]